MPHQAMASDEQKAPAVKEEEPIKEEAAQEDAPAAKKQRTEEGAAAAEPIKEEDAGAEAKEEPQAMEAEEAKAAPAPGPKKIGYKTFETGAECFKYFHDLMTKSTKNQNLNEVRALAAALREGAPPALQLQPLAGSREAAPFRGPCL